MQFYAVHVTYYISRKAKATAEALPPYLRKRTLYRMQSFYAGSNRREMQRALWKACRAAKRSPLAVHVTVWDGAKMIMRLQIERDQ